MFNTIPVVNTTLVGSPYVVGGSLISLSNMTFEVHSFETLSVDHFKCFLEKRVYNGFKEVNVINYIFFHKLPMAVTVT